ncbi:hypothetical protein Esti_004117 [Eimeria stiedai]
MLGLRSAWRWCFDVSNPKDPKLRGWLHPTFALTFNFGLASAVALLFFLATPSMFQEMWLRRQPAAVLNALQQARKLADSLGYSGTATVQWLRDSLGRILQPDIAFVDKNQVFAIYSWEGAILEPQFLAASLLVYVSVMLGCRLYEKGPVMLYDMAWACNMSIVLTAAGEQLEAAAAAASLSPPTPADILRFNMRYLWLCLHAAIWLNIPFLVSACSCWVAVDQLLWYADTLAFLVRGRFLIGLAKYMANKDTPLTKKIFSTHHLWFIPLTAYINLKHAAGHTPCCLAISLALSLACVLGSRCCTPYCVVCPKTGLKSSTVVPDSPEKCRDEAEEGRSFVLNVNVAWRCWADVSHHIPLLGICDRKPWYVFVVWNQLIWGLGNCFLFGIFLFGVNHFRKV